MEVEAGHGLYAFIQVSGPVERLYPISLGPLRTLTKGRNRPAE